MRFAHLDRDLSRMVLGSTWFTPDRYAEVAAIAAQVAVAWVLHQPFVTFAAVGADGIDQLRIHAAAADIDLTPDEVAWLSLDDAP